MVYPLHALTVHLGAIVMLGSRDRRVIQADRTVPIKAILLILVERWVVYVILQTLMDPYVSTVVLRRAEVWVNPISMDHANAMIRASMPGRPASILALGLATTVARPRRMAPVRATMSIMWESRANIHVMVLVMVWVCPNQTAPVIAIPVSTTEPNANMPIIQHAMGMDHPI
jgi:hypothetical protein